MKLLSVFGIGLLRVLQANLNKQTSRYTGTRERSLRFGTFFELATALFSLIYLCFTGFYGFNRITVLCALLTGICFLIELLTALAAMRGAPLVLCNFCALGGGIILPSVAGIFFFNEPLSLPQWLGVAIFFLAVWFLSPSEKRSEHKVTAKTASILFLNFLVNGFCSLIGKYFAVREVSGNVALFTCLSYAFSASLFGLCALLLTIKERKDRSGFAPLPNKLLFLGLGLGVVCSTIAYFSTLLARSVPIVILNVVPSAISIIGCLLVGGWLFKEKIAGRNLFGVALGILSAILIISF